MRIAWQSTFALLVLAVAGVLAPDTFGLVVAVLSIVMFGLGLLFLLLALLGGLRRSRLEEVTVSGLFLLHEAAPRKDPKTLFVVLGLPIGQRPDCGRFEALYRNSVCRSGANGSFRVSGTLVCSARIIHS